MVTGRPYPYENSLPRYFASGELSGWPLSDVIAVDDGQKGPRTKDSLAIILRDVTTSILQCLAIRGNQTLKDRGILGELGRALATTGMLGELMIVAGWNCVVVRVNGRAVRARSDDLPERKSLVNAF